MRIVLFAPTARSLYSRLVAHGLRWEPGAEVVGIFIRRLWSYRRIQTDLRREGPRLLQKIFVKLILPESSTGSRDKPLSVMAREKSLGSLNLVDFGRNHRIPVHRVRDFNSEASETSLRDLAPDLIVFTGGGLIRKNILRIPTMGVLNCHSGLLPRYRGMDTLEWTILEAQGRLPEVGLTLHFMDTGVDTGPILRQYRQPLSAGDELAAVRERLEPEMVRLILAGVRALQQGELEAEPQKITEGRQYFVIHPRLQAKAALKLKSFA